MNDLPKPPTRRRPPWLLVLIALAFLVPVFGLQGVAMGLKAKIGALPSAALAATISALGAWAAYTFYVRRFEGRPVTEFGRRGALRELAAGLFLGLALFTAVISTLSALGSYRVTGLGTAQALVVPVLLSIGAAVIEETVFRGVLFRLVEAWGGTWTGLAVSSALFGLGHAMNPQATLIGVVAIVFEAGIMLAAAFMLTRRLWLAIGLHAGWNIAEGGIFGVRVSGLQSRGLLNGELVGPEWLTGGQFGAEASLVAVAFCVVLGGILLTMAVRRGRFVRPSWRRGEPSFEPA